MTFAMAYAYLENFILPISLRRSGARQGLDMFERAPQMNGGSSARCARSTPSCWAHPGEKLLFMGTGVRPASGVLRKPQRRLWWQSAEWGTPRLSDDQGLRTRSTKEHPALWKRDTDPSGFSWIDADATVAGIAFSSAPPRRRGSNRSPASSTSPLSPRQDHQIGLPTEGYGRRS